MSGGGCCACSDSRSCGVMGCCGCSVFGHNGGCEGVGDGGFCASRIGSSCR